MDKQERDLMGMDTKRTKIGEEEALSTSCRDFSVSMGRMEIRSVPDLLSTIRDIAGQSRTRIVCLNAEMMAGRRHAEEAIRQAIRAEKEGTMTARSLEMEVMLYASGQRQTSLAMRFGLHEGVMPAWIGIIPNSTIAWDLLQSFATPVPDEEGIPESRIPVLQELFGITDAEIKTVGKERIADLVIERTALLNILK